MALHSLPVTSLNIAVDPTCFPLKILVSIQGTGVKRGWLFTAGGLECGWGKARDPWHFQGFLDSIR